MLQVYSDFSVCVGQHLNGSVRWGVFFRCFFRGYRYKKKQQHCRIEKDKHHKHKRLFSGAAGCHACVLLDEKVFRTCSCMTDCWGAVKAWITRSPPDGPGYFLQISAATTFETRQFGIRKTSGLVINYPYPLFSEKNAVPQCILVISWATEGPSVAALERLRPSAAFEGASEWGRRPRRGTQCVT